MTMVVAAMTRDYAFMVSDRRLTYSNSGKLYTDHESKTVILNDQFVLAYTGLGDLGGMPTHRWVASALSSQPPEKWLQGLAEEATKAIRRVHLPRSMRAHTFLLVGYAWSPKGQRQLVPVSFIISNCHSSDCGRLATPRDTFIVAPLPLANLRSVVFFVGSGRIQRARRLLLQRTIRRYLRANPERPQTALAMLASEVLAVAERDSLAMAKLGRDSRVGRNLLATSFPRKAYGKPASVAIQPSSADWEKEITSVYVGDDARFVTYGPTVVYPGLEIADMRVSHDPTGHPPEPIRGFSLSRQRLNTRWQAAKRRGSDRPDLDGG